MENIEELDIVNWVAQATDETNQEFREAIHTILLAIANDAILRASMILKGGILLAVRYHSHRFTTDIDMSTDQKLGVDFDKEDIIETLDNSLALAVEELDYGLDCRIQSSKQKPNHPNATFPSIKLKIGYAYKDSEKHKRLQAKQSSTVIEIDYSSNEMLPNIDNVQLSQGEELKVYSLIDLVSEKYRSLLQQVSRNRNRRQDVYDLALLLEKFEGFDNTEKQKILSSLIAKSQSRNIEPKRNSIEDPELIKRAQHEYLDMAVELNEPLPSFDQSFKKIAEFYKSLPW